MLMVCAWVNAIQAQYYSVNYDKETVAAMATAFGAEAVAEGYYSEQVGAILKHTMQQSWRQQGFSPVSFWNARQ